MLYYLLKYLMRLALPVYYRHIRLSGLENIPASGAVILACNHPNSFLDAIVMGTYAPRPLHFLTRSDVFNTPLKRWILSKMNMVPIYRMRDGMENLEKNQETFAKCREVLSNNGVILIFSEGICIQELKLRPLKKGTARIALDYAEKGNDLWVVPVGLNYPHPMKVRKSVWVGIGQSFNARNFAAEYRESPAKGILSFNKTLEAGLRQQVIHLDNSQHEPILQQVYELTVPLRSTTLAQMISAAERFQKLDVPTQLFLKEEINRYAGLLNKHHLYHEAFNARSNFLKASLSVLVWITAAGLSLPSFMLVRRMTRKKVRLAEFKDSVTVAAGMVLSLLLVLVYVGIALAFSPYAAFVAGIAFLFLIIASPPAWDVWTDYRCKQKLASLSTTQQENLSVQRQKVTDLVTANLLRG